MTARSCQDQISSRRYTASISLYFSAKMLSIQKLAAAVVSGTQETSIALGNVNFDFALFKLDAPVEYTAVGAALTPYRRTVSEEGDIHGTARKLRALFEQLLPATPSLYKAYGIRASEIVRSPVANPKPGSGGGPFAKYTGVDGVSLWAAATSGAGAIAIHLLACMIARQGWSPAEATSIWEELVARRKAELSCSSAYDPMAMQGQLAARTTLNRDQLADWDASARAWLSAADDANRTRQLQLRLIVDNVNIPVDHMTDGYKSVMNAWITTLKTVDKMIEGMPHSVQNGAVLLGLSAWHLYPDMVVLSGTIKKVEQSDDLMDKRGILTLGLSTSGRDLSDSLEDMRDGVYWSLPLTHLRYYGDPVVTEKNMRIDGSRVTMAELKQVVLGAFLSNWNQGRAVPKSGCELLVAVCEYLKDVEGDIRHTGSLELRGLHGRPSSLSWLTIMASTAKSFLKATGKTQEEYRKFASLGRRCSSKFLCSMKDMPSPMFGLFRPSALLGLLRNENDRVTLLRRIVPRLGIDPASLVIRYRDYSVDKWEGIFGYATVAPVEMASQSPPSGTPPLARHKRWIVKGAQSKKFTEGINTSSFEHEHVMPLAENDVIGPLPKSTKLFWHKGPTSFVGDDCRETPMGNFFESAEHNLVRGSTQKDEPTDLHGVLFDFLFGDPDIAAIYCVCETKDRPRIIEDFTVEEVEATLLEKKIQVNHLLSHIVDNFSKNSAFTRSLKAFSSASSVYEGIDGASITMKILTGPLGQARWISESANKTTSESEWEAASTVHNHGKCICKSCRRLILEQLAQRVFEIFEPFQLDRACTFACIASLESGNLDISGEGLGDVMAMAVDDSLYIASSLLCDPLERPTKTIKRIRGNLGRAGIAMMIPPESPKIRASDVENWKIINHYDFDGKQENCFESTSLHLSFTGWTLPINTRRRGARGVEAYFLETLVSAHDRGQWVADLSILPIFEDNLLRLLSSPERCKHSENPDWFPETDLVSLDSWPEILERPSGVSVVRAKGNWLARLAATTLCVTVGHLTIVLGDSICWKCSFEERERFNHKSDVTFIM